MGRNSAHIRPHVLPLEFGADEPATAELYAMSNTPSTGQALSGNPDRVKDSRQAHCSNCFKPLNRPCNAQLLLRDPNSGQ